MDLSQLFSKPPLSSLNGLMNKMAMVAGVGIMHGLGNMLFYLLKLTWL